VGIGNGKKRIKGVAWGERRHSERASLYCPSKGEGRTTNKEESRQGGKGSPGGKKKKLSLFSERVSDEFQRLALKEEGVVVGKKKGEIMEMREGSFLGPPEGEVLEKKKKKKGHVRRGGMAE